MMPSIVIISLVFFYPIIEAIRSSFFKFQTEIPRFVGFDNFRVVFGDEKFWVSIKNNSLLIIIGIPILVFLSLILAVFLYDRIKFWKGYRFIAFMPYIIPITVICVAFSYILTLNGILNEMLRVLKIDFLIVDWLGKPKSAMVSILFVVIWKELGFGIILMLARMFSLSEDIFEAAKIDGANWWQNFIHIIIPQLRSIIEFYAIILIITMFSWVFNYVYIMTKGGPGISTWVGEMYIYQAAFRYNDRGIASAASFIILAILSVIITLQLVLKKDENHV